MTPDGRRTEPDVPTGVVPADYFSRPAVRGDARAALVFGERRWTYAELDRAADAAVSVLREEGVGPGDCLAYLGRNSDGFLSALTAAMRMGALFTPLNWRNAPIETRYLLDDCNARLLLVDGEFLTGAAGHGRPLIVVDDEGPGGLAARVAAAMPAPRERVDPDAPCLQLYTSGTTGKPKGVLTSQGRLGVQREMEVASGAFDDWADDEVLLCALPTFHIGGLSWAMTGFARGQTVVLTNVTSPHGLLDLCVAHGVTRIFLVPTLLRALLDEVERRGGPAPRLRGVHYGAAPMDAELLARAIAVLGARFLQNYGMTEATGTVVMLPPADHDLARPELLSSIGKPPPGCEVEIRDPQGRPALSGAAGEIWVRSPGLMIGYAGLPQETAAVLRDGWYRTGDGGRRDSDGYLRLTDRIKDVIVSGGENVYPAEVEAALRQHPAVQDCAVFGVPDARWGEGVAAAVELRPGEALAAPELITFARGLLAGYKVPRRIEFSLPLSRTASGKVQRGAVRRQVLERDAASADAPQSL